MNEAKTNWHTTLHLTTETNSHNHEAKGTKQQQQQKRRQNDKKNWNKKEEHKKEKEAVGKTEKSPSRLWHFFKPLSNILLLLSCRISSIYFFCFHSMALLFEMHIYGMECVSVCNACTLVRFLFFGWADWQRAMNERTIEVKHKHTFLFVKHHFPHIYGFLTVFNFYVCFFFLVKSNTLRFWWVNVRLFHSWHGVKLLSNMWMRDTDVNALILPWKWSKIFICHLKLTSGYQIGERRLESEKRNVWTCIDWNAIDRDTKHPSRAQHSIT